MRYTVEVYIEYIDTIYTKTYNLGYKGFKIGCKKRKVRKYNLQKLKEQALNEIEKYLYIDAIYIEVYDNKYNLVERLKVGHNDL